MTMRSLFLRLFGLLVAGTGLTAGAGPEYVPIQEKAQGRSLSGANLLNDSLYTNPASSAFTQAYVLDASMQLPKGFGVSILDTRTSAIGGGIGYFRRPMENGEMLQGGKLVAVTRLAENIGIGIAGKLLFGPASMGAHGKLTDVDAGILLNLLAQLQLGLVTRNLFGGERELDQNREVALGARIGYDKILFFSATATAKQGLKPYQYGFGAEFVSPYYVSLKGGYWFQPSGGASAWSAGASIISSKLNIHYAVEFPEKPGAKMEHQLGLTLLL